MNLYIFSRNQQTSALQNRRRYCCPGPPDVFVGAKKSEPCDCGTAIAPPSTGPGGKKSSALKKSSEKGVFFATLFLQNTQGTEKKHVAVVVRCQYHVDDVGHLEGHFVHIYILYIYHFHKGHGIEWRFKTE